MAKIVFMGTPEFAVPTLRALLTQHDVVGVVTQPDRPAGRSPEPRPSPIKQVALEHNIPVFQPEKLRRKEAIAELRERWQPDVYVVAAFGQILPQAVLDIPAHGSINVHASLLPRWRGAAPIQAAIRAGDTQTGITIMKMDAGLDTGPMLTQRAVEIAPDETGTTLHDKLAAIGGDLLLETLPGYLAGTIQPQPQDDDLSSYAPMIPKDAGHIRWTEDAASIERAIRAYTPWPGTYAFWNGTMLKILRGSSIEGRGEVGRVIQIPTGIAIGTGSGLFYPTILQLAGRKAVSSEDFMRGHSDFVGALLE